MKSPRIATAIGFIDDDLIKAAASNKKNKSWSKWSVAAACIVLLTAASVSVSPMILKYPKDPVPPSPTGEIKTIEKYIYDVDEGPFSSYIAGRVIAKEKLEDKIADVSVTGGWKNATGEWISHEKLRAEVYQISGISIDAAVALRFIDKGEALTTTHYYVILNPTADLSELEKYAIAPRTSDETDIGIVNEQTIAFVTTANNQEIPE